MSIKAGQDIIIPFAINETDTLAGTSQEIVSPVDGFVNELKVIVQKAVTTGGTVKAIVGTTDVAGAVATVANAAAKGTVASASSTAGSDTRKVTKGGRIQVKTTSFATAGAVSGYIIVNTAI